MQLALADGRPTQAPLYIGLVGLARGVPWLIFGLFGGAVANRADWWIILVLKRGPPALPPPPVSQG